LEDIDHILKSHNVRSTKIRKDILQKFITSEYSLSHSSLEKRLSSEYDRVTIYRTIHKFEECGIIHRISDDSGKNFYGLCSGNCNQKDHQDEHIHFKCTECENIYCLKKPTLPTFNIPDGYTLKNYSINVDGICKNCNN
jgi:Fur family ferric uptake transcriptional regulator